MMPGGMERDEALAILGLDPEVTHDARAVGQAYQARLAVYREDALASYALMDESERARRLEEIESAYRFLSRPDPQIEVDETAEPAPRPPPPVDPEAPGASLRRAREHLRLDLEALAQRTRILRTHLEALEEERFEDLPPVAYVRGFALQYARCLGIEDAEALAQAFVVRLRALR